MVAFKLDPRKNLKRVIKDGKKEGYVFDRDERVDELEEMNNGGAFTDIELDAAAMEVLLAQGGEQEQKGMRVADPTQSLWFRERHSKHDL